MYRLATFWSAHLKQIHFWGASHIPRYLFHQHMEKYLSLIFFAVMTISTIQDNLFDPATHSEQQRQIGYRSESIPGLP